MPSTFFFRILKFATGGPYGYELTKDGQGLQIATGKASFGAAFNEVRDTIATQLTASGEEPKTFSGNLTAGPP